MFWPQDDNEELFGPKVSYLSVTLMYLVNNIIQNISLSVNLLAWDNSSPTKRHLNEIKHILCYIQGKIDMSLLYLNKSNLNLVGFVDSGYLSNPHKARSQTCYLFTCWGTTISWRSVK